MSEFLARRHLKDSCLIELLRKRKQSNEKLCAAVGVILAKYKVGKYFDWKVEDGKLSYTLKEDVLAIDRSLDGCYVIRTDAGKDILSKEDEEQKMILDMLGIRM